MSGKSSTDDRVQFATGAVRGVDVEARYDLISGHAVRRVIEVFGRAMIKEDDTISEHVEDALFHLGHYKDHGDIESIAAAAWYCLMASHVERGGTNKFRGALPPRGIEAYANAMTEGAVKYSPFNWLKGFPIDVMVNHAEKHMWDWFDRNESEDQLGHAAWNLMGIVFFHENRPELASGMYWYNSAKVAEGKLVADLAPKKKSK